MEMVATTSLPAVGRLNADRPNAARSCQNFVNMPEPESSFFLWEII